nr:ribonuclease H-like domain-containing protein [Tanacetum cinerariifolium]
DNGTEFKNANLIELCGEKGIKRDYSTPKTPQQNGVAKSDHLGKFEGKADEGYLVGYASNSKAYRVYNLNSKRVEETMNLRFMKDKPNIQGIGHEWYFDLDYLSDSLGYTRFKTDTPAGAQATNIIAGNQYDDSDSEYDEQVIVDAAERYGYLFSQETADILSQAEADIWKNGVSTALDSVGKVLSAGGISAGSDSAGSMPAGS